ncbi:MAG: phosphate signaling complex protein PhoU [Methanobacterium sp.]
MAKEHPRISFNERLNELKDDMRDMGKSTLMAYKDAISTLFDYDEELVKKVTETGEKIDKMSYLFENKSMSTIAAEQPVAKDLRFIESSLKVGSHLKRIGNLAVNIAEVARHLKDEDVPEKPMHDIKKMAYLVEKMVSKSLDSFLTENMDLSRELHYDDDVIDDLFDKALNDITKTMFDDKDAINYMVYLIFLARFLERIADRAESIGNRTIFMITCEKP